LPFQIPDADNAVRRRRPLSLLNVFSSDYPHSDSTWPWSQEILDKHTKGLNEEEKNLILHDNVADLYHLSI